MLKVLMRYSYRNKIYTDEPELFYELYKWNCGLFILISARKIIGAIILWTLGIVCITLINFKIYGLVFIAVGLFMFLLEIRELNKKVKFNSLNARTPAQIRTITIQNFIRRQITTKGKALGKKEWEIIKKYDKGLYNDLLCDECEHCCYSYSLEIAKIIKDSILIWGAIEEPFEKGHNYYAHAVILRKGYIYDSNMHQSEKYEDFIKLYKFKIYKQWNYDEYSQERFRTSEREDFRKWCKENNVLVYEKF